jgi:catechol 2,3-dioxygenase-like lactoylglutathione lyase family enzyme
MTLDAKDWFSSYSVDDIEAARAFYGDKLGLEVADGPMGILELHLEGGKHVMVYPKGPGHQPATYTVLNFIVEDIEATVDSLAEAGVEFEQYDTPQMKTDAKGIATDNFGGPRMAWFKDPAGNIVAVMQQR